MIVKMRNLNNFAILSLLFFAKFGLYQAAMDLEETLG